MHTPGFTAPLPLLSASPTPFLPSTHSPPSRRNVSSVRIFAIATPDNPSAETSVPSPRSKESTPQNSLPPDFGAQFEQTLKSLQDWSSIPPQQSAPKNPAERFLTDLKLEHEEQEFDPEHWLAVASAGDALVDQHEDYTSEQEALLDVLDDHDYDDQQPVESPSSVHPDTSSLQPIAHTPSDPSDTTTHLSSASSRTPTSDPTTFAHRTHSPSIVRSKLNRRIEALRRRRSRLILSRGDNPDEYVSSTSQGPVADILESVDRENAKNLFVFSLARARVIDVEDAKRQPNRNALTADAENLIRQNMAFPSLGRPFFAMQAAFERLDNPPCPRCHRPTPTKDLQKFDSVCSNCYTEIYLEEGPSSMSRPSNMVWDKDLKAQRTKEESRAANEAVAVAADVVSSQRRRPRRSRQLREAVNMSMQGNQQTRSGTAQVSNGAPAFGAPSKSSGNTGDIEPPAGEKRGRGDEWEVRASDRSMRTINPIRNLIQNIDVKPNPNKDLIKLSVGDPTVYGNLKASERALERFCEVIRSKKANGYTMSMGDADARTAVANRYTSPKSPLIADDVVLTAGTSGALEIAIGAIANEGDNILLPKPGFPLFRTIAEGYGVECRFYNVKPDKNWEIELSDLVELADSRTAAIVVNNPSNPCGSVFSASHIEDLMATASMLKLPVIADEVYADMVFSEGQFTPIASKSVDVPVLSVGGVSKQFVVPGWRLGWILIHDRNGVLEAGGMRKGIRQLTTRMLVPNTPTQAILPTLLEDGAKDAAFKAVMQELKENAAFTVKALSGARGVRVIEPKGAMYVMAEIDVGLLGFKDDMEFTEKLLEEEAVFVLPGRCFQAPNFVRIVFSAPQDVLSEAFFRIRSFCGRHSGGM